MSNVRFYRLGALPPFVEAKHQGIFVHLTAETTINEKTYKAGLWFGGATGWEYLTNDTTPQSITDAINALDVTGYAQATMNTSVVSGDKTDSKLTILGIKEDDGKISNDSTKNVDIAINGVYNESTNKIATQSTVTNAINGLDTGIIQPVEVTTTTENSNTTLTFKGVKEIDGKIYQGDDVNPSTLVVGDAKLQIKIGSTDAFEVFSANAQENKVIQLDGNVFKKKGDVISVITKNNDVSSTNPLVTQKDIDSLAGAMHYKGTVSSLEDFNKIINNTDSDSDAEEAGNVYIATGKFTHGNNVISTGDMIVFNGTNNYNVIQSNITLGTGVGQVATNDESLISGNVVIATRTGIKTIGISESDLTDTDNGNNTRTLSYANGEADASDATLFHSTTITDTFKVIGKDFTKTINISSNNRSIEIEKNATNNGILVDLVWNTSIE